MPPSPIRIFVSSPSDVDHERMIVREVVGRLAQEYRPYFPVRAILWEDEALTADRTFQASLTRPAQCEIVLVILWTRLGSPLPEEPYRGRTGTEWEFLDAVTGLPNHPLPEVLVYKKTAPRLVDIIDTEIASQAVADRQRLDAFFRTHFFNEDNSFRRAFRTFDSDGQFRTLLDTQLRKLLNRRISAERRLGSGERDWHGSPFRPHAPFAIADEQIFTGREAEIRDLLESISTQDSSGAGVLTVIHGASGCGKTSLVQAGLIPQFNRPYRCQSIAAVRCCQLAPTHSPQLPLTSLAEALCRVDGLGETLETFGLAVPALARLLVTDPALATTQITTALHRTQALDAEVRLALIIDPLDPLLAETDEATSSAWDAALDALMAHRSIWVMLVLRTHALAQLAALPSLEPRLDAALWLHLPPLPLARLRQVVEIPARIAGLDWEVRGHHRGLIEQLEQDASLVPLWLPWVQQVLDAAYQVNHAQQGTEVALAVAKDYQDRGGLAGDVLAQAQALWSTLPQPTQAALPRLCRALITLEDHQVSLRWGDVERLERDADCRALLSALIEHHLVVVDGEAGAATWQQTRAVAAFCHPILLTAFAPITDWLADPAHQALLHCRAQLLRQAQLWQSTRYNREYLFAAAAYSEVRTVTTPYAAELEPLEQEFLQHSQARLTSLRRRTLAMRTLGLMMVALVIAASSAAWIAWQQSQIAQINLHRAQLKEADFYSQGGNTPQAITKALAAGADLPTEATRILSIAFSRNRLIALAPAQSPSPDDPRQPAVNATGSRLVTLVPEQGAQLWELKQGRYQLADSPQLSDPALALHQVLITGAGADERIYGIGDAGVWRLPAAAADPPDYPCPTQPGAALALDAEERLLALATVTEEPHGGVCVLDLEQRGRIIYQADWSEGDLRGLSFAPDGQALLTAATSGRTHLITLDLDNGSGEDVLALPVEQPLGRPFNQARFDPSGERIAIAAVDERVRLYQRDGTLVTELSQTTTGGRSLPLHTSAVRDLAFAPDGQTLVAVDDNGQVVRWSLAPPYAGILLGEHALSIVKVEVAPEPQAQAHTLVLTASLDRTARVWSLETGRQLAVFGHDGALTDARLLADSHRVATFSVRDGSLRLWSLTPMSRLTREFKHPDPANHVWHLDIASVPNAEPDQPADWLLASAGFDGWVRLWQQAADISDEPAQTRGAWGPNPDNVQPVRRVRFSPSGRWLAAARFDGTAQVYDLVTQQHCTFTAIQTSGSGRVVDVRFDPDERWLAVASENTAQPLALIEPESCQPHPLMTALPAFAHPITAIALHQQAENTVIVVGDRRGQLSVLRLGASQTMPLCSMPLAIGTIGSLAIDPLGRRIAAAGTENDAALLEFTASGCAAPQRLVGHSGQIYSAQFSADGQWLVTASLDKTARVWQRNGTPLAVLEGHQDRVYHAEFAPNHSEWLLTAARDGDILLWRFQDIRHRRTRHAEAHQWQSIAPWLHLPANLGGVAHARFTPDGQALAGAYWDNALVLWRLWQQEVDPSPEIIKRWQPERARLALIQEAYAFRRDNQIQIEDDSTP